MKEPTILPRWLVRLVVYALTPIIWLELLPKRARMWWLQLTCYAIDFKVWFKYGVWLPSVPRIKRSQEWAKTATVEQLEEAIEAIKAGRPNPYLDKG